jgi:hypothetical protein
MAGQRCGSDPGSLGRTRRLVEIGADHGARGRTRGARLRSEPDMGQRGLMTSALQRGARFLGRTARARASMAKLFSGKQSFSQLAKPNGIDRQEARYAEIARCPCLSGAEFLQ